MKKFFTIFLVLILIASMVVGCAKDTSSDDTSKPDSTPVEDEKPKEDVAPKDEGIAKIGLGTVTSIAKSKDAEGDKGPGAEINTTLAAVAFDGDDKVAKITIDVAQTKVDFDKDLKVTSDLDEKGKTKIELGDAYGMVKASEIGKEWYEQAAALEEWMIGKTVSEIKSVKVKERDASHTHVPDVPELTSVVTVTIQDYITAVEDAYKNAVAVEKGVESLGLGTDISIAKSKSGEGDNGPLAQVDNVIAIAAYDKDGKVVRTIIDTAQTKVEFDSKGKLTTDKDGEFKTKVELGDEYGMRKASGIDKEWFEQATSLEEWMAGKTIDEIKGMKLDGGSPDVAELTSSVTMSVEGYIAAVEKTYKNAK